MAIFLGMEMADQVTNTVDTKEQIQPAGIELTVKTIKEFKRKGALGFNNSQRVLPETKELEWDRDDRLLLDRGSYLVDLNEYVAIPINVCAIALPRSSLLRMGVSLGTALWDPGYMGHGQVLLNVNNPNGVYIYRNARILQLVFMQLTRDALKLYDGVYQGV